MPILNNKYISQKQKIIISENKLLLEEFEQLSLLPFQWNILQNSTILITGATGLIGSVLIKALLHISLKYTLNIHILAYIRDIDKFNHIFNNYQLDYITGDTRDKIEYSGQVDYIFHCAAVTKSKEIVSNPVENLLTSIIGTKNIMEFAKDKKVKDVIYISSMEMYGTLTDSKTESEHKICDPANQTLNQTTDVKVTEQMLGYIDLANPRSSYPEGKRTSECLCNAYYSEYGLPVKIARLAQTFGAGVSSEENRVFAQFAKSAVNKENIVLHTDGSSEGNYCYLADVISGLLFILLKGQDGETYNIVNEDLHMTIKQMAEFVAKNIAADKISVIFDIPEDIRKYGYPPTTKLNLSGEKLKKLGWKPAYGMKDMYERMIGYWQHKE